MPETALYPTVKRFLEAAGFAVKGEVWGCAIVAVRNREPSRLAIVEMKLGFSLEVMRWDLVPFWAKDIAGGRARAQLRDRYNGAERIVRGLHNRMPVVLAPEAWPQWLGEEPVEEAQLKALLAPYPSDGMVCWPVSPRVGNVKNNDPGLVEPIALP